MSDTVQRHYEKYPYPHYPLLASLRRCDTYALNLQSLWIFSNGTLPPPGARTILVAGCGTFAPYPFALANQDCTVTALDLSQKSLKRARMHCLLHGRRNLRYVTGDLINRSVATGPFGLIDAYGVLHHLKDPLDGLRALEQRLMPGGIMRLMLYSRSARREKESIRHALRLLGVTSVQSVRDMVQRAPAGSRLRSFFETSDEVTDDAGLADALLHPCARTYRIDEVLHLLREAGLKVLRYAHSGALPDIKLEENRLRNLEREQCLDDNWYEAKNKITRILLQTYGTEIFREMVDANWWVKILQKRICTERTEDILFITDEDKRHRQDYLRENSRVSLQ